MDEIEVFRGVNGQWFWHRIAANDRVIAIGGEGFSRRWSAKRAARRANRDTAKWVWA